LTDEEWAITAARIEWVRSKEAEEQKKSYENL